MNFKKKKYILNNYFNFLKKIINCFYKLKFNESIFYKNFKIYKLTKKRFLKKNFNNLEIPKKIFSYYFLINFFLLKKNTKFIILKKNISFNKIIYYNNLLLIKIL
ncbi:MAG: hypothetical protein ACTXNS_01095 [Candidatus Carsonella ruddii]